MTLRRQHDHRKTVRAMLMAAVVPVLTATGVHAEVSTNAANPTPYQAVTISLSGSTAMRNFTVNAGFSQLRPTGNIVLNNGLNLTAPGGTATQFQLASSNFTVADDTIPDAQTYSALRVEWHEQGSVEGILELSDSQIDQQQLANSVYDPTSGNGTFVNRLRWGGTSGGTAVSPGPSGTSFQGLRLTNQSAGFTQDGINGQSAVQMAISDVVATQGFAKGGVPAVNGGAFNLTPSQTGYGKGNPALAVSPNVSGKGIASGRQQLQDQTLLNMSSDKVDPATLTNYAASKPWNTAGVDNLQNTVVAQTATLFAANPGTGLTKVNRSDAQWLQATGRLANGADFNVTTRDVNSGTRNVAALNVGLDPSFASGESDAGNGDLANGGTAQVQIGSGLTFSNKTAGGAQLRPVVQVNRMAVGHLSISDSQSASLIDGENTQAAPVRGLRYSDSLDGSSAYVLAGGRTLVDGSYAIFQNQTYVTVKNNNAAAAQGMNPAQWAAATDATLGIKGDNASNDVADFRGNILQSVATFPNSSIANPADALANQGFLLPQVMMKRKDVDGVGTAVVNPSFNANLAYGGASGTGTLIAPAADSFLGQYDGKFKIGEPASVKIGNNNVEYGESSATADPNVGNNIRITLNNYFFGDFNQSGSAKEVRDFSDLLPAQQAQAALQASGHGTGWKAGNPNSSGVTTGLPASLGFAATKGDLIALGDFNGDGAFTGKDLYMMARGTSLANNASSTQLTLQVGEANFGDMVARGVLRKNAALDQLNGVEAGSATAQQRGEASVDGLVGTFDDYWAFSKFDVNRDGISNAYDLHIVRAMQGKSVANLNDQLTAAISGVAVAGSANPRLISLVDVELNDNLTIDVADLTLIRNNIRGDFNLDGFVDFGDLTNAAAALEDPGALLAQFPELNVDDIGVLGDWDGDGVWSFGDITPFLERIDTGTPPLLATFDQKAFDTLTAAAAVPEPASASVLILGAVLLAGRRKTAGRRRRA